MTIDHIGDTIRKARWWSSMFPEAKMSLKSIVQRENRTKSRSLCWIGPVSLYCHMSQSPMIVHCSRRTNVSSVFEFWDNLNFHDGLIPYLILSQGFHESGSCLTQHLLGTIFVFTECIEYILDCLHLICKKYYMNKTPDTYCDLSLKCVLVIQSTIEGLHVSEEDCKFIQSLWCMNMLYLEIEHRECFRVSVLCVGCRCNEEHMRKKVELSHIPTVSVYLNWSTSCYTIVRVGTNA